MAMKSIGDVRGEIVGLNRKFMDTYRREDAEGMGELYTTDAEVLPPNGDTVRGKRAIGEFWGGAMRLGIRGVELETREVERNGDAAVEVGTATLRGEGDQVLDQVKYIVVWKREGGEWKLHRDIWNSSRPAV